MAPLYLGITLTKANPKLQTLVFLTAVCVCLCLGVNEVGTNRNQCAQRLVILRAQTY